MTLKTLQRKQDLKSLRRNKCVSQIILKHISAHEIKDGFQVISLKDGVLLIACKNPETATILRFEKRKYISEINLKSKECIDDIKIVVS